jgi:uncharacterized protein YndB with AHSA1/START domain
MAWTQPEHLKKWFIPAPWTTVDCEIDLRPGGMFRTVIRSSEAGLDRCLEPGFRPARPDPNVPFYFTAIILTEPEGKGTRYTAIAMHPDEEGCQKHDAMGFHTGWGKALDQLVAHVRRLER